MHIMNDNSRIKYSYSLTSAGESKVINTAVIFTVERNHFKLLKVILFLLYKISLEKPSDLKHEMSPISILKWDLCLQATNLLRLL